MGFFCTCSPFLHSPALKSTHTHTRVLHNKPQPVSRALRRDFFMSCLRLSVLVPSSRSLSSRRESFLSRRSVLSISSLIRFASFASSLRQHAIMESRVMPLSETKRSGSLVPVWVGLIRFACSELFFKLFHQTQDQTIHREIAPVQH